MPRTVVPVILCGGAGSRLWPVSRQLLPKQFLPLVTGRTLLQDTALRAQDASSDGNSSVLPIVICNEAHRFLVNDQLAEIGISARIVLEPAGRSTAAAVAVENLKRANRSEHLSHRRVYRPWGYFESVDGGERYQVKRLMVKPGHALSLQLHRKRAEHSGWWSPAARASRAARTPSIWRS